jgi:hypothetical protein
LLASHFHFKIKVNLNGHMLTARGAQPQIFIGAGFASVFQFRRQPMLRQGCPGVDQVEFAFAEIAKSSRTGGIRALRKHGLFGLAVAADVVLPSDYSPRHAFSLPIPTHPLGQKSAGESIGR